jgi:hypothetical protein
VLSDVELKIQGFDLGKLLGQVRTSVSPPDEINDFVEKTGGSVRASVNWPSRPLKNGATIDTPFETGQLSGEASAALAIAASIVWAEAANAEPEFAKIPRDAFVAWALTWWDYRQIRVRAALGEKLSEEDKKRWTQARRLVDSLTGQATKYPEIWRLRADIIEASISVDVVSDQDRAIAREDRIQYAKAMGLYRPPSDVTAHPISPQEQPVAVQPGLPIWARSKSASFPVSVTVTAIALDSSGKRKLLVPAYAILDRAGEGETEFSMTPEGPVVARASKKNIIFNGTYGTRDELEIGVALATIEENSAANNGLAGAATLKAIAPIPSPGAAIKLFTTGRLNEMGPVVKNAVIQKVDGLFIVTDGRATEPGDGGAPVVDADGNLIAMGYSGTETDSRLLSLDWLFQQAGLKLAP